MNQNNKIKNSGFDADNFLRAAVRLQDLGATANGASRILNELGAAAAAAYWPTSKEIALMRMDDLFERFGWMCFFMPSWWRWRKFANKP